MQTAACSLSQARDSPLQELQGTNGDSKVMLEIELPEFPHAVIYQQAAVLPGPGPSPLAAVQVWNVLHWNHSMA